MLRLLFVGGGSRRNVHLADCAVMSANFRNWQLKGEPVRKPAKILLTTGKPWTPKRPRTTGKNGHSTYSSRARQGPTNYRLTLQFYFERPIGIEMWRKIKAPPGWRKCPTSRKEQEKYYGVRFMCRDLKHSLTSEEVETLRAKLYLALELVF